ncbi:MAG: NADH-quinone oxidoreductase subunit L [Deltaproteobacteria bacterium]|nr:NADH-quinone oxidoreductase subunit L [Deltaproteobacteria bacterium]
METVLPNSLLPLILLLPAAGALLTGLLGRRLSKPVAGFIATLAVFASFGVAAVCWWMLAREPSPDASYAWVLYRFLETGAARVDIALYLDRLSAVMALVVTGVSAFIHLYSLGYMHGDRSATRYFSHLNMFVFFMLLLVLGKNLLVMFVGWEGVGLSSYLLIGFWYEDGEKAAAGQKAFVVNRIGDFGFLLAIFLLLLYNQGDVDFLSLQGWAASGAEPTRNPANMTLITLLLFLGAVGKSAQLPLYVWLPDAMAGPTPVSALIHAATMVTAGVYMVARLSFLFHLAPLAMAVVATVGAATALFAATIGLVQRDIKKVLAYSTVSQLGYMFLAVGTGAYAAGIFHLTTHAFFKACLFLGAGSVIHAMAGEQDLLRYGGLGRKMRVTQLTFLVSTLAIAGLPPLAGFFSKDAILFGAFAGETPYPALYKFLWAAGVAGAALTAFYMTRLYWLTFHGEPRMDGHRWDHAHESPWTMTLPLVVLAVAAATAGLLGIPGEHDLFHHWLSPVVAATEVRIPEAAHHLELPLMGISVAAAVAGLLIAYLLYRRGPGGAPARLAATFAPVHRTLLAKYWVDELYDQVVIRPLRWTARWVFRLVDRVAIDLMAVHGSAFAVKALGVIPRLAQNGDLHRYLAAILVAAALLVYLA